MNLKNKKRLLILSVPAGAGHMKAAEALCQTAKREFGMKVDHVNFLEYFNPMFSRWTQKSWNFIVKYTPVVYKFIYEGTDKPNNSLKRVGNFLKINIKKYQELVGQYKPDLIISTHYIPAAVTSWMYDRLPITNGVVITDYEAHSMWVYPNNNKVFVARKKMIEELENIGFDKNKVCVSGIPVRENFLKSFDIKQLRRKIGLYLDKPTLLIMGGGDAVGPFVDILKSLSKLEVEFQVVVIAGKNEKMRNSLENKFKSVGLKGKVLGFVKNIEDYMMVADLLVSKPGGLTTTESITIGLPMLIVRPTPGQEDGNTEFLVKARAGIYIKDVKKIGIVVGKLLRNPGKIKEMKENSRRLSKPKASKKILEEMLKLVV
ncbi:MAG: glycosyltransferase [Candidatus Shapirobacteria bacterium]|nr:glycosyltransferase [Candidatus Shapirobacteria bacterium]